MAYGDLLRYLARGMRFILQSLLLQGADIEVARALDGATALLMATYGGHFLIVQVISEVPRAILNHIERSCACAYLVELNL